jgi:hypothetical protein
VNAKQIIERADLDALLLRLSQLKEPVASLIEHRSQKSPDFIIEVGGERIGVETTRSVYQEYVRALKLQARDCANSWVNLTHLVDHTRRRSTSEIRGSMLSGLLAPWKRVDQSMMEWEKKIGASLLAKRRTLNGRSYEVFRKNWLLIHDTPGLPDYPEHFALACQHLGQLLSKSPPFSRDFDSVYVHSNLFLFRWMAGALDYSYNRHEG